MNTQVNTEPRTPMTAGYRQRMSVFLESRRGKMFGVAEVVGMAGSCLVLALVLFSYLYFVVPARSRIKSLNADRQQLQTNLKTLDGVVNKEHNTQQTVDRVAASLNRFETENLMRQDEGRMESFAELNQLILKNGLKNTSGPTFTTLDPAGMKTGSGKSVITKWQSFYPGVSVMVTVEGPYENIRRFIRDVERSRQFLVINEVELQRAEQNSGAVSAEGPAEASSGSRGSLVSLQLNMATYFQRENVASTPEAVQE